MTKAATVMKLLGAGTDDATALAVRGAGRLSYEQPRAVVTQPLVEATGAEPRELAAGRLADLEVSRNMIFRPEIPKGATGKLQRIGLAPGLGLAQESS